MQASNYTSIGLESGSLANLGGQLYERSNLGLAPRHSPQAAIVINKHEMIQIASQTRGYGSTVLYKWGRFPCTATAS